MSAPSLDTRHLDLRIVPTAEVLLHERTDPERVRRLTAALIDANVLRNPPVVAQIQDGRFVVLDGATRTTAIRELGINHILVQVVDYGHNVDLNTWHHLLRPRAYETVIQALTHFPNADVVECSVEETHTLLSSKGAAAAVASADGKAYALSTPSQSQIAELLCNLVDLYGGFGEIYRIANEDLDVAIRASDDVRGVVLFPSWTPADIIAAATTPALLPAGITRHGIHGRALNVNLSLDMLSISAGLDSKREWLDAWLRKKMTARKVRYYHEAVFLFDD